MKIRLMKILTAIIFGFICVSAKCQTNRITGAFGFTLGAKLDGQMAPASKTTDGEPMYEIVPKNAHEYFNEYYVMVTPATHQIYCIWAIGPEMDVPKAKIQEDVVFNALTNKYGRGEEQGIIDTFSDQKHIDQGNRAVFVNVTGLTTGQLNLKYIDADLQKKARDVEVELESKNKNNSGL